MSPVLPLRCRPRESSEICKVKLWLKSTIFAKASNQSFGYILNMPLRLIFDSTLFNFKPDLNNYAIFTTFNEGL